MSKAGKTVAISPFRWMVIDLMHFSMKVPAVTIDRRMNLAKLVSARQASEPRPSWTSIFVKAWGIIAARRPVLRQFYMSFPWARYYEHPKNIAAINVSRQVDGEDIVLQAHIRNPENRSLGEIDEIIRHHMTAPVETLSSYVRVKRTSRLPGPMRRFLMWATINWFGRRRCHNLGTFSITSVAAQGAGILTTVPLLTSTLHYGLFDVHGCLDMRVSIDHRVLDGAPAAEALAALEEVLMGEILAEVTKLMKPPTLQLKAA